MTNKIDLEKEFNQLREKFEGIIEPNDYSVWFWGHCYEEKYSNMNILPGKEKYLADSFKIIKVSKEELHSFEKHAYLELINKCSLSKEDYKGAIYFYRV